MIPRCWTCNDTGWRVDHERSLPPYSMVYVLCECRLTVVEVVISPPVTVFAT